MLVQVGKDMFVFLLLTFWILIGFSFCAYTLQIRTRSPDEFSTLSRITVLKSFYELLLGDFGEFKEVISKDLIGDNRYFLYIFINEIKIILFLKNNLIFILLNKSIIISFCTRWYHEQLCLLYFLFFNLNYYDCDAESVNCLHLWCLWKCRNETR